MGSMGKQQPNKTSDEELVRQNRQGRQEAFTEIVKRYEQELYHFLVRFMGSRPAAEDVFQDTFLQVHRSLDTFQLERRFKPWLFTIAANKARDHLRRNKRRAASQLSAPIQAGGEEDRQFLDLMQSDLPLPADEASKREIQQRVRDVIEDLPEHLREILVLAYFHQLPYKEIAGILDIPLGTVKSRLHSAVGTFAECWRRLMGDQDESAE
ncbi:MAG: RNA polymerase subunit sigma-70 [Phycisphaeraceae bacterium]|nr:RNA polymerase subunit sigma-70 [Phycisphaeraceae bacterium]